MAKKIFNGIKQVNATQFNEAKENNLLSGYLWFVRTPVDDGETNDVANDEYDIYFGSKQYGHFQAGELAAIKSQIEALNGDVSDILDVLDGLTELAGANKVAHEANATAISGIQDTLETLLVKNVDANDTVLNVADGILSASLDLKYENNRISLIGKNDEEIAGFGTSDFIKDSVLEDVEVKEIEGEKYIVFTWKTEGEDTKTDSIKVSDFAKLYKAGNALELAEDGVTFNVKVAANNNFLSVHNNELIVDDMTVDKTLIKEDITIEGGPLASEAVKKAFAGGVIPAGTNIQAVLKALLCVEIYPTPTKNTPSYKVSIKAPSITAVDVKNGDLVEVGQVISFNEVVATGVEIEKTEPKVSGFKHGYSNTIDGDITEKTSISASWTIEQKENNVYELTGELINGEGGTKNVNQSVDASDCKLAACQLKAVLGTNIYSVTEDAPKHTGKHDGIDSYYVVSNLGGRTEAEKSVSIAAESNLEKDPENQTATFTVTGVYPVFTNGVQASTVDIEGANMENLGEPVKGDGTKLALMEANTEFAVSFAAQSIEPYKLFLPNDWKIKSAKAIDSFLNTYSIDCQNEFVAQSTPVTRNIQGENVNYTVYEWKSSKGANRVKFTVA